MITPQYLVELAAYNEWQNSVVFNLCAELSDEARKLDRRMFFRSLHDTLDHILCIDRLILRYVDAGAPPPLSLERQCDEFEELRSERVRFDAELRSRASAVEAAWLLEEIVIHSERLQRERRFPRGFLFTQMFNHQTHHRSQVTTHLHLMGIDYGSTDLPYNPNSLF